MTPPPTLSVLIRYSAMALLALATAGSCFAQDDDPPFSTSDTNVGYVDCAIPMTQVRFRFDAAYDNPTPDRAEFFYRASTAATGVPISPAETNVNYQSLRTYLEFAPSPLWSLFLDVPVRFIDPERNDNEQGFSDLELGAKGILWMNSEHVVTGQLRAYVPTGDASRLLGTDHASLEPALLHATQLSPLVSWENEARLWIPIDGTEISGEPFAGPILRLGTGIGIDLYRQEATCSESSKRLSLVSEFVGWTILDGLATVPDTATAAKIISVDGDTTVNTKLGLRWSDSRRSVFAGYGRSLTGHVWYHDIVRAEYAIRF
ncbi:hypothetical protein C2E31_10200 [Rhodopirellula baltica]|nr:hypothetical protein C2E31_10200 [Rhodopirellula baltica]